MSEISKLQQLLIVKKIDNETVNILINDNEMLMSIVGQFDENLKKLSKLTNTNVYFREIQLPVKAKENLSIFVMQLNFWLISFLTTLLKMKI